MCFHVASTLKDNIHGFESINKTLKLGKILHHADFTSAISYQTHVPENYHVW